MLASQRERPRTRFELAVEEMASGRVIGACELSLIERNVVDLGYMLGTPDWGKGYATEISLALVDAAFFDLRAERVISTVEVNNSASIRVLEKIGMRWEAVFRKHRRAKNRWWDCHLFVLPREVWEASRRPDPAPESLASRPRALIVFFAASCSRARSWPLSTSSLGMPVLRLMRSVSRSREEPAITRPR